MYHTALLTFQHPWATNIPLVLLVKQPPIHYGFTTPKGLPPKGRRDRVPSNAPACNQPIHPGHLVGFTMFTFQNCMDRLEMLTNPLPPQEASPINPPITQQEAKPQ